MFLAVDVGKQSEVANTYNVRAVPCFILCRNRTVLSKVQGANPVEIDRMMLLVTPLNQPTQNIQEFIN